ncbi:TPA: S-layer protein [Bacillus mobilis]|uniref:S-layer protein n=1 Tax=Bacillus mobilis TaxID=2026190 RepID=UPI0011A74AB6|nr:S-layer protein [Bacillus mobilis]MED4386850.1 S-layer protein [Bacillus mobilis]HDX9640393.1 S-layer protein [Bacillus mobilis]
MSYIKEKEQADDPAELYLETKKQLYEQLTYDVAEEIESFVERIGEAFFQKIYDRIEKRNEMLEEEVSKPLRNPDNKEVYSQCITRFFQLTHVGEIRDELKGMLDFPHLGKCYYDFIEEISKNQHGHLFKKLYFTGNVFEDLKKKMNLSMDTTIKNFQNYYEAYTQYTELVSDIQSRLPGKKFVQLVSQIMASLVMGFGGSLLVKGLAKLLDPDALKIVNAQENVRQMWEKYNEQLKVDLEQLKTHYKYVQLSLYGGAFVTVNKQLKKSGIEFQKLYLQDNVYKLQLIKEEQGQVITWATETISHIQLLLKQREINQAIKVSNQFYQHVSEYPVMERTIINNGKSIKYYANLLKFAALMCKSLELYEKEKDTFITFTAELFKQLPMVVHDHDLRNLGLMTKTEFIMKFLHHGLKENQKLNLILDYEMNMIKRKDKHDLYPGEELKEFSSSQYLAILLARFMKSKRQKINSFYRISQNEEVPFAVMISLKRLYKKTQGWDSFYKYLLACTTNERLSNAFDKMKDLIKVITQDKRMYIPLGMVTLMLFGISGMYLMKEDNNSAWHGDKIVWRSNGEQSSPQENTTLAKEPEVDSSIPSISVNDSAGSSYNFKVKTKQELKQILEIALMDGKLGPFGLNVIGKEQSAVKQEFGTPDALQGAECTACDAPTTVTYGDYNLDMFPSKVKRIWLYMNIPVNEFKSWLGEPYGIEEGIDSDALVYRKEGYAIYFSVADGFVKRVDMYKSE